MKNIIPIIAFLFTTIQINGQDSTTVKSIILKTRVTETTVKKGYLTAFSDSGIFISSEAISFNPYTNMRNIDTQIDYQNLREVYLRRKGSTGRGILIGSVSGAAFGALIGLVSGDDPPCKTDPNDFLGIGYGLCSAFRTTAGQKAAAGSVVFGLGGGIVGAVAGALAHKNFVIGGKKENFNALRAHLLKRSTRSKAK